MLEEVNLKTKLEKADYEAVMPALKQQLAALDAPLRSAGLPVIILFEGWSAAGKGKMIGRLIKNLDPRWFKVVNTQAPTELEQRYPLPSPPLAHHPGGGHVFDYGPLLVSGGLCPRNCG